MDVNFSECLVRQSHWGETVITNICSGAVSRVPWAMSDWAGSAALGLLAVAGVVVIAMFTAMGFSMIRDVIRGY